MDPMITVIVSALAAGAAAGLQATASAAIIDVKKCDSTTAASISTVRTRIRESSASRHAIAMAGASSAKLQLFAIMPASVLYAFTPHMLCVLSRISGTARQASIAGAGRRRRRMRPEA